jgi:hypothetical protein
MSSVKYVQSNSLIANINEKIDELNRKIISKTFRSKGECTPINWEI